MTATLFMFLAKGFYRQDFASMELCTAAIERLSVQFGEDFSAVAACVLTGFAP